MQAKKSRKRSIKRKFKALEILRGGTERPLVYEKRDPPCLRQVIMKIRRYLHS
jgi:hypothetical protein